jgi:protein-tyrosine-phosphatase
LPLCSRVNMPASTRWPPAISVSCPAAKSRYARAGSDPADKINPIAVEAMAEEGIDVAAERPKILTMEAVEASDVVITMGCGDTCPYYPANATRTGSSTTSQARISIM